MLRAQTTHDTAAKSVLSGCMGVLALKETVLLILLRLIVDVGYVFLISPLFSYRGLATAVNPVKLAESYLMLLALGVLLPRSKYWPVSYVALRLAAVFIILPLLSFYALADASREFALLCFCGFLLTTASVVLLRPQAYGWSSRGFRSQVLYGTACISLLMIALLIAHNGLPSLRAFSFGRALYEVRAEGSLGGWIRGYMVPWTSRVFLVFLGLVSWNRRKWGCLALVAIAAIVVFLYTGQKSFLFALPFALFLAFVIHRRNPGLILIWGSIAVILGSLLVQSVGLSTWPASLVLRRTLFVPAQITYQYHDFFSANPKTYLTQSRIGSLLGETNPYPEHSSIAYMMGDIYANNPSNHRNTGYLGASYMNLGWIGIPVVSILLGFLLALMDILTRHKDSTAEKALLLSLLMSVLNSALLTATVTHGLGLGLLVVWLYRIGAAPSGHTTFRRSGSGVALPVSGSAAFPSTSAQHSE